MYSAFLLKGGKKAKEGIRMAVPYRNRHVGGISCINPDWSIMHMEPRERPLSVTLKTKRTQWSWVPSPREFHSLGNTDSGTQEWGLALKKPNKRGDHPKTRLSQVEPRHSGESRSAKARDGFKSSPSLYPALRSVLGKAGAVPADHGLRVKLHCQAQALTHLPRTHERLLYGRIIRDF